MQKIITENRNENTKDIDIISTLDLVNKINDEDMIIAQAVRKENKNIAVAIDLIAEKFLAGGKLYYFGAGTSGRLGVLDASECPPTFGVDNSMVVGTIAGGDIALRNAIEGAEDNFDLGVKDSSSLTKNDVCVLISASGNPNYLLGVAQSAQKKHCDIISLTCNDKAKINDVADIKISVAVGPEVIAGSSRMKAGTAQKMVLNMLSTGAMIKIGKTYENFMIDVRPTNQKLKKRAIQIVMDLTDVSEKEAIDTLISSSWQVKTSVLMIKKHFDYDTAVKYLKQNHGILRKALNE
jgi:N-acetylmuramic acid 6-phosphate etherase